MAENELLTLHLNNHNMINNQKVSNQVFTKFNCNTTQLNCSNPNKCQNLINMPYNFNCRQNSPKNNSCCNCNYSN